MQISLLASARRRYALIGLSHFHVALFELRGRYAPCLHTRFTLPILEMLHFIGSSLRKVIYLG